MADKKFIGKVFEKTFSNGGSIYKLSLNQKDLELLSEEISQDRVIVAVKKSKGGKWYAEIDDYQPSATNTGTTNTSNFGEPDPESGLPF